MVAFTQLPLWLLVVAGSFLVGVSSLFGPILLSSLDGKIRTITGKIEELKGKRKDDVWNRTVMEHEQVSMAIVLLALSEISSESKRELVLDLAVENAIRFVINSLTVVLGDDEEHGDLSGLDSEEAREWLRGAGIERSFTELDRALRNGDLGAYRDVENMRRWMMEVARWEMLQAEEEHMELSGRLQRTRWWKTTMQYVATSLSLIGLTLVLLGNILPRLASAPLPS